MRPLRNCFLVASAAVMAAAIGCGGGGGSTAPTPTDASMLRGVVSTYRIATRDLGRPPQNVEELKTVLAPVSKEPMEYLISKRDGEEFVIVWNVNLNNTPADTIVAYERTGVDGKRMVVSANANVREVSADEFSQLKFPKGSTPGG
jgi:hypothetical protein